MCKQTFPGIKCIKNFKQMEDYGPKLGENKLIFRSNGVYRENHLARVKICAETWQTALFNPSEAAADRVSRSGATGNGAVQRAGANNGRSVLLLREEWRWSRPHGSSAAESSPTACVYPRAPGPNQISMTTFANARLEVRLREYRLPLPKPLPQIRNRSGRVPLCIICLG